MAIERITGKIVSAKLLDAFVVELFAAAGVDSESATAVARALVDASSRGVDTHGVRLAPWYLRAVEGGRVNRRPNVTFTLKSAAVGHVDSDDGFGHLASFLAIEQGCVIAEKTGIAAISVGRSTHHGATGVYTLAAAHLGFAAIGMTHADSAVVPSGGIQAFYGTNPISFATPALGEEPLLLDMATSSVPFNRVAVRRDTGAFLPPDVAVDASGAVTRDPNAAVAVLPLGGLPFGYKGSGLAAMVDILCSAFTGMGHGATLASFSGPDYAKPIRVGHFFLILNPSLFQALGDYDARIAAFLADLRHQPAQPGERVMAPGDLEKAEAIRRARDGVPIDNITWKSLVALAARYGVSAPVAVDTTDENLTQ
jgi:ureidoglycolate dehydrogenase (NAD+)